jgi:hypothetical protein
LPTRLVPLIIGSKVQNPFDGHNLRPIDFAGFLLAGSLESEKGRGLPCHRPSSGAGFGCGSHFREPVFDLSTECRAAAASEKLFELSNKIATENI